MPIRQNKFDCAIPKMNIVQNIVSFTDKKKGEPILLFFTQLCCSILEQCACFFVCLHNHKLLLWYLVAQSQVAAMVGFIMHSYFILLAV